MVGPTSGTPIDSILVTIDPATGAVEIDMQNMRSAYFLLKLTGNVTLTLINAIAGARLWLEIEQDAAGSRTVTWPAGARIKDAVSTAANALDAFCLGVGQDGKLHQHSFTGALP